MFGKQGAATLAVALLAGLALARPTLRWTLIAAFLAICAILATPWKHRQRSPWLQVSLALVLNSAAVAAWVSLRGGLPAQVLWLWVLLSANSVAAVLLMHARLEGIEYRKSRDYEPVRTARRAAWNGILVLLMVSGAAAFRKPWLAVPGGIAAVLHAIQLLRLRRNRELIVPLPHVSLRAMFLAIAFGGAVVACLR